jgi:hypothetical protein
MFGCCVGLPRRLEPAPRQKFTQLTGENFAMKHFASLAIGSFLAHGLIGVGCGGEGIELVPPRLERSLPAR